MLNARLVRTAIGAVEVARSAWLERICAMSTVPIWHSCGLAGALMRAELSAATLDMPLIAPFAQLNDSRNGSAEAFRGAETRLLT